MLVNTRDQDAIRDVAEAYKQMKVDESTNRQNQQVDKNKPRYASIEKIKNPKD